MIKAILFDMDGTLVNSEKYFMEGTLDWMSKKGINLTIEDIKPMMGTTMDVTYNILHKVSGLDIEEIKRCNNKYFYEDNPIQYGKYIFEDTYPTLKELKKMGIKIVICSLSMGFEVRNCINDSDLHLYVDDYLSSDDCKKHKPDPEIYLKALEKEGLNKDEVLIVEDSKNGILAGINSGCRTIVRKDNQFGTDQSMGKEFVNDLREIVKIVKDINHE